MKTVEVAAAIIADDNKRVLVSQRHAQAHQGGLWEFPGGKIETGESVEQALVRELQEELAITIQAPVLFHSERHQYHDKNVHIHFYWVRDFSGTPQAMEAQIFQWANCDTLQQLEFPDANQQVLVAVIARLKS